ncbi:MAG: hypothetical protein Q9209_005761 [Squamulea sp. 1 TL-2023]
MCQRTVDIAIIGMACRVAGANSPSELWDNLLSSKDVQRRITRFNIDGFHHPEGAPRKGLTNVDRAYMLDDDVVDKFDNAFFHINPTEAAAMDPQQRMLLELSYEAIENAGLEGSDYHTVLARDIDATPKYIVTGTAGCMASNRLSYFYDLSGPSVTVDTACSSSMAAFHQAIRTLQHGDSNMALVCGANLIFNPESFITMTELGFLSQSGRCRSFDAHADGYGRGEGVCCLLLKPLEPAESDGNPIWAVVKGTRLNQDGRTQGITLPSAKAQEENMYSLHKELQIDNESIQYLEAHVARMGCELLEHSEYFRSIILTCDSMLQDLPQGPSWSIIDELSKAKDHSNIDDAQYSQPLCTALQIGLISLLRSWGVKPTVVVGHSSGEIAAAYAAGMISLRSAVIIAYYRGYVLANHSTGWPGKPSQGSMCAVGMSEGECETLLKDCDDRVQIAAVNSPLSCTLSGDREAILMIIEVCTKTGRFCRQLKVNKAYHSNSMLALAAPYKAFLKEANIHPDPDTYQCEFISSVTGQRLDRHELTSSYWVRNMTSTVQFASAAEKCLADDFGINCIVEIGPHPALKSAMQEILRSRNKDRVPYLHTCHRDTDDFSSLLECAGGFLATGVPLDAKAINADGLWDGNQFLDQYGKVMTDLPSYQWNHTSIFWSESRVSRNVRHRGFPRHELLGSRYVDDIPSRACWRNHFDPSDITWWNELNVSQPRKPSGCKILIYVIQTEHMPSLSTVICISMATEAARQIVVPTSQDEAAVRITNVKCFENMFRLASPGKQEKFETQFISKKEESSSRMSFEIFRTADKATDGWQLCSTGTLELAPELPKVAGHTLGNSYLDSLLGQRVHALNPGFVDIVENLQIVDGKIYGDVSRLQQSWQTYAIHPVALASILSLGPTSVLGQNLPVKHRISSIPVLEIQIKPQNSDALKFNIETSPTLVNGATSKFEVTNGSRGVLAGAVQYTATEVIPPSSITNSLFFRPLCLPDITKHVQAQVMDIDYCMQLVMHKRPMSDIIIRGMPTNVRKSITGICIAQGLKERKKFRSIFVMGDVHESNTSDSAQYVTDIEPNMRAHILFTDRNSTVDWLLQHLRPAGLVCIYGAREESENILFEHFDYLCEITDSCQRLGALWRKKTRPPSLLTRHPRITFANESLKLHESLTIRLQPEDISAFMNENRNERFDAILVDDLEKSIITTWSGSNLIPWLQYLMKHAESLLWVTLDASASPFVDIAGTLLRTLQAEQPSLKVSWLCLDHMQVQSEQQLVKSIESAYASMICGENEARLDIDKMQTRIVRYLPDQDLSAAIGVVLPRKVDSPIGNRDYLLTLAAPNEPVVLSHDSTNYERDSRSFTKAQREPLAFVSGNSDYNSFNPDDPNHEEYNDNGLNNDDPINFELGKVRVSIAASVIDGKDVAAYNGQTEIREPTVHPRSRVPTMALGTFFAGKVLASTASNAEVDSSVIGWAYGAHTGMIVLPETNIIGIGDEDLPYNLARFASLATAMAVLDGHVRVRKHDTLRFRGAGTMLEEAFSLVCQFLNSGYDGNGQLPPFIIETSEHGKILVNKVLVDVHTYLSTHPQSLTNLWKEVQEGRLFKCSKPQYFPFRFYKAAFQAAIVAKDPVVLLHNDFTGMTHVPIYRHEARLFSSRGAYVIIGGLGGLGRYTCSWLVDHGATSLYAISRSGISSPEAQEVYDNLNSKDGVRLEVIKADACDRASISNILSLIRTKEHIKGVINMAMILGDAPMATMTGEEWDRALKVKIESSWILHEETKEDDLKFFILFSSIASVLGNRNQGSYNVGNTFLNALATYRRRERRTAVAVALGAMTDIGVLSTYATPTTPLTLTRSGLTHLTTTHLDKILEAAFYKSRQQLAGNETVPEDAIMVTGLDMWEDNTNGAGDGTVYWRGCPEFSHLAIYKPPVSSTDKQGKERSLKEKIKDMRETGKGLVKGKKEMEEVVMEAFLPFLSRTLGFPSETFDTSSPLSTYGLDSLNAVGVQYWCWREVAVNVSVAEVFEAKSITGLISTICERLQSANAEEDGEDEQEDEAAENDEKVVDKIAGE